MYSTTTLNDGKMAKWTLKNKVMPKLITAIFLVGSLASFGCGKTAPVPLGTVVGEEKTYVVESTTDGINAHKVLLFSLDLSIPHLFITPDDQNYPKKDFGPFDNQHYFTPPGTDGCVAGKEAIYERAMGTNLHPVDTAYVGTMRVDLQHAVSAPDALTALCFAVHTTAAGWKWHMAPIPIVIDYGSVDVDGKPGAGHFDLDIQTNNVDLIAFELAFGNEVLSKVTYTAIAASP